METSSSTSNSSSPIKAFALALALVVVAHVAVERTPGLWAFAFQRSLPSRDDHFRLEANLKLLPGDSGAARVFLMGSSQAREDFDVAYLNERFDGRATFFNLGFSGNGNPVEMNMLLPKVLQRQPDLVVYMPFIGSLFRPYTYATFDLYFHPTVLTTIRSMYGWSELVDRAEIISLGLLRHTSVLFRHRETVRNVVNDAATRFVERQSLRPFRVFAYHRRKPRQHYQRRIAQHHGRPRYREHRYRPFYQESFMQMATRLKNEGIPLIVIDGPTHPLIKKVYDPTLDDRYHQYMTEMAAKTEFTHLSAEDLPDFTIPEFTDFTHLHDTGRTRFNRFFADYLEQNWEKSGEKQ